MNIKIVFRYVERLNNPRPLQNPPKCIIHPLRAHVYTIYTGLITYRLGVKATFVGIGLPDSVVHRLFVHFIDFILFDVCSRRTFVLFKTTNG